jgi:hypothetical protein
VTLLLTEIFPGGMGVEPFVLFVADRRLSSMDGRAVAKRPKVMCVPGQRAAVGYFGLAQVGNTVMDRWLLDFLAARTAVPVQSLAVSLAEALNGQIPEAVRRRHKSGFHLSGLDSTGVPVFWKISNLDDEDDITASGTYRHEEQFQRRDAARLPAGTLQVYRNGDGVLAQHMAWPALEQMLESLFHTRRFNPGQRAVGYSRFEMFKVETLATCYERFTPQSVIGRPIDGILVTRAGANAVPYYRTR